MTIIEKSRMNIPSQIVFKSTLSGRLLIENGSS